MNTLDYFKLDGKVAIITGSGKGIGRGIAHSLAGAGADIVIADIDNKNAQSVKGEIEKLGRKSIVSNTDITDEAQVQQMREDVLKEFGKIDILINNAGVMPPQQLLEDMSLETWAGHIETNLTSVFICSKLIGQQMIEQKKGNIINIASVTALVINTDYCAPYAAAKAGVISFTKACARDWARHNIRVNSISPGYTNTPLGEYFSKQPGFAETILPRILLGRQQECYELGNAAVFLASDASSYVTGSNLISDGGFTAFKG